MCLASAAPYRASWVGCVWVQHLGRTPTRRDGTGPNAIPHTREGRGPVVVGLRVTGPLPGQRTNGALVLPETEPAAQSPGLGPVAPVTFTRIVVLNARRSVPPHLRQTRTTLVPVRTRPKSRARHRVPLPRGRRTWRPRYGSQRYRASQGPLLPQARANGLALGTAWRNTR